MGLWDLVKDIGSSIGKALTKKAQEIQYYKNQYELYDDDKLKYLFKSSTGTRRMACFALLRERGYDVEEIQ